MNSSVTASDNRPDSPSSYPGNGWRTGLRDSLGLLLMLAGLILFFSLMARNFFSATTFRTIANQIPDAIVLTVGLTLVMIAAGIDLSVGSVLALCSAVLGVCMMDFKLPLLVSVVFALLAGLACGFVNGAITVRWRLPSFIVTLGMLEAARGGAYLLTGSQTKYIGSRVETLSNVSLLGLSLPFLLAMTIVILAQFVLTRTVFGRYLMAVGENEEAARYSGINPRPVKVGVFALCGLLSAVAAVIQTSRLSAADPNAGTGAELQAIAAAVIGGTSLMGGRGSVVSSFLGVLIIAVLSAGLSQTGAQEPTRRLVTGAVIIIAVILDYYRSRLAGRK